MTALLIYLLLGACAGVLAGLLGIGQIGVDAGQDMWSLGGPAVEQIMDSFTAPLSQTTLNALPANPLYKNWVN